MFQEEVPCGCSVPGGAADLGVDGRQVRDAGEASVLDVGLHRGPVLGLRPPLPIHVSVEVWLFLELPAHTPCLRRNVMSSVFTEGPAPFPVSPVTCPQRVLSTSSPSEWAQPPPSLEALIRGSGSPSPGVLTEGHFLIHVHGHCRLAPLSSLSLLHVSRLQAGPFHPQTWMAPHIGPAGHRPSWLRNPLNSSLGSGTLPALSFSSPGSEPAIG